MALLRTQHLRLLTLADGVAALVLDCHDKPLNLLDPPLLHDLDRALDVFAQAGEYHLLVICSAKAGQFCHGLSSAQVATWSQQEFASWAENGQKLCAKLLALSVPSIAVIAGSCWDAGLELALACDYRIVVNNAEVSLGFHQLEWGLTPCWGSTQRLPRLVGLQYSLQLLLAGERYDARQSWNSGLADDLADEAGESPPAMLAHPRKRDWSLFPRRTWREQYLESTGWGRWFLLRGAERILRTRISDEFPAPAEMLQALRLAYQYPDSQPGLEFERLALHRIVEHPALHHLIRLLQQREKLRASSSTSTIPGRIRQVGILGAGVLGLSLLLHGVSKGYEMVLRTHDEATLAAALKRIMQLLQAEVQNENMTPAQYQKSLAAIRGTHTWNHFDQLDMVVDTEPGPLADRQAVYRDMEGRLPASALLVANPIDHRVSELQTALLHPERLLGMHIIEPWNRGSLAEIIGSASTSATHVLRLRTWATSLGRCCLVVPDRLGGLAMRVWLPALNEAGLLVREGVSIYQIDAALRRFGMTHGPLEWMDRLGLDHIAAQAAACQPLFAGRITFESGFALMVEKHWLGNRAGLGFYRHHPPRQKPHADAARLWRTRSQGLQARAVPVLSTAASHAWVQNRLLHLMILEAVRCLEEGLAASSDDVDCALCLTGWATHRGGPIGYARQRGYDATVAACRVLAERHGARFAPMDAMKDFLS